MPTAITSSTEEPKPRAVYLEYSAKDARGRGSGKQKGIRRPRTSLAQRSAAVAKASMGESKSKIARDLGIDTGTVYRILNAPEIKALVEEERSRATALLPPCREAVEYHVVERRNPFVALQVMRGLGVLREDRGAMVQVNVINGCPQDWANRYQLPAQQGSADPPVIEGEVVAEKGK